MGEKENGKLAKDWRATSDPRIKRRHTGQLYARFSKRGIRIEQRLHETNMAAASRAVDLIEECLRDGKAINEIKTVFKKSLKEQPKNAVLISEHWAKFIEYRKTGDPLQKLKPWRPKTLSEYLAYWDRAFEPFYGNKMPDEIGTSWPEFIKVERARSKKGDAITFNNHIKYFGCFAGWLVENDLLDKKPNLYDPNWATKEDDEDDTSVVYTDKQVLRMIKYAEGSFGLFIRCAALMGMRSSEITQLKKDRISLKAGFIKLRASDVKTGSKTNKGRTVPIHKDVAPQLAAQIKESGDSEYLFPNRNDSARPMDTTGFRKAWVSMAEELSLEGSPHCLRHTYATKVFGNPNINHTLAAKALGMSMQTAERVYIHFREDQLAIVASNFSYQIEQKRVAPGTGLGLK